MEASPSARYAAASLACAAALKNRLLATSVEAGWTSCVLDHVEGDGVADPHETHVTPDLTVVVATRGAHDVEVLRGGRWRAATYRAGSVGLTRGGEATRLRWRNRDPRIPFRTAHLYVPQALLLEAVELVRRPGQRVSGDIASVLVMDERVAATVTTSLLAAMERRDADTYAETGLRWLSLHLVSRFGDQGGTRRHRSDAVALTDARLARAVEFMAAHLAAPITVAEVAHEAGVSPFHFARLFARRVGVSPHAYLVRCRMDQARHLLATTDLPVAVIAAECGYATPASFTAAFARRFGRPPTAMR